MLALFVSAGALILGVVNFLQAHRRDKRDLFLRLHETLVEPDVVAGRRALYKVKSEDDAEAVCGNEEISTRIYRALAMFDVLGLYVESRWIDERTVLREWSNSLVRSREPARLWIAKRYEGVQWHSWPHYTSLAEKAARIESGRKELARASGTDAGP